MKEKNSNIKSRISYAFGNLGQSAYYNALSTYFMVYLTSVMFAGIEKNQANKLIGIITGLVVVIRLVEILIDPLLGNIIDNTETKWGKFKPWQVLGSTISSILLVVIFTGVFGLAKFSAFWFIIIFIIAFIVLDVFYSFRDISYWGMIPAISEDSQERSVYTAWASFTGSIGYNGLTVIVVPMVTYFTYLATGKHYEGSQGWLAFALFVAILGIVTAYLVAWGTTEKDSALRATTKKNSTLKDVFLGIAHNDQMLWTGLSYLLYSIANVATSGGMFYLFKFILDKPNAFWIAGIVPTITGLVLTPLYPSLNKRIPRKYLFMAGEISMVLGYLLFIVSGSNLVSTIIALLLFYWPQTFIQMTVILTLTDSIEYGQLKNGNRNEAVTLAIRPMLDKIAGALSNGIVGLIAIAAGMTGSATAADMTAKNIHVFKLFAYYTPIALVVISFLVFLFKVKISEKKHAEIVEELQKRLANGEMNEENSEVASSETVSAPVAGKLVPLTEVDGMQAAKGFAIKPIDGKLYAPFDGRIKFTFSTKHTFGIVSDNGLSTLIHVGIGTVNLRGYGFDLKYEDGQKVKKGQLLMTFDRELIKANGYDDIVVTVYTQPQSISEIEVLAKDKVEVMSKVEEIKFK